MCVLNRVCCYTCLFIGIFLKFAAQFFICTEWIRFVLLSRFYTEDVRLQTQQPHLSWKGSRAIPMKRPMVFLQPLIRNDYSVFFCPILLLDFVCFFILLNIFLNKNKCRFNLIEFTLYYQGSHAFINKKFPTFSIPTFAQNKLSSKDGSMVRSEFAHYVRISHLEPCRTSVPYFSSIFEAYRTNAPYPYHDKKCVSYQRTVLLGKN